MSLNACINAIKLLCRVITAYVMLILYCWNIEQNVNFECIDNTMWWIVSSCIANVSERGELLIPWKNVDRSLYYFPRRSNIS